MCRRRLRPRVPWHVRGVASARQSSDESRWSGSQRSDRLLSKTLWKPRVLNQKDCSCWRPFVLLRCYGGWCVVSDALLLVNSPRLQNDLYCVECDVKVYYTIVNCHSWSTSEITLTELLVHCTCLASSCGIFLIITLYIHMVDSYNPKVCRCGFIVVVHMLYSIMRELSTVLYREACCECNSILCLVRMHACVVC